MKRGLINCNGKTPDATMASALYTDLKQRDVNSIFVRPHEGLFGLREWTTEENGHFEVCCLLRMVMSSHTTFLRAFPTSQTCNSRWKCLLLASSSIIIPVCQVACSSVSAKEAREPEVLRASYCKVPLCYPKPMQAVEHSPHQSVGSPDSQDLAHLCRAGRTAGTCT